MLIDFRTLFPKYGIKPKGVLHVGANIGEEAPVYLELGIKRQIWIEANPLIFLKLKQNIANNPEAKAFNYCISDKEEDVIFHVSNNGSQSSSILELGTHAIVHPEVHYVDSYPMRAIPLSQLYYAMAYGYGTIDTKYLKMAYDFLNIDLQGAELKALKGLGEILHEFKWVYLEVNDQELYKGCALFPEVESYLQGFGFRTAERKMTGAGWGDCLFIK